MPKAQLTKAYIEANKLNITKQHEVTDSQEPALRVIFYANKVSYVARVFWQTKRYYLSIGTYPYVPLPKARQLAAQFKCDVQTGEYNHKGQIKFSDFVYQHFKPRVFATLKYNTAYEYMQRLESMVLPTMGDTPMVQVGRSDVINYLDNKSTTLKPSTVNRYHSLFGSVFSLAVEKGFIDENKSPVKCIKKRKENNTHKKVLPSKEQVKALIKFCNSNPNQELGCDLILLLLYTGMRLSEALSLKISDIKNDGTIIWIQENKASRPVGLPANSEAQAIIKRLIKATWNEYLFPSPVLDNRQMGAPRRLLTKLKNQLKLNEFGFHYCRAIFCTAVAKKNVHMAQKLLNHSDIKTTNLYIYHDDSSLMQATESVVAHYNN
ncbi:MAG: integrase family protein [Thalassotalea sp.]|nr:integrase family protein [Thalassotalea sp.]